MKNNSPLIISVTGWSGSGKTKFCEKLITELLRRGARVAAAKNSHRALDTDKPGSDSKRFFDAGAEAVCLNADNSMTLFYHQSLDDGNRLAVLFPEADYIVAEGFKADGALRIEVTGLVEDISGMKNPAAEADMIVYGAEVLAGRLRAEASAEQLRNKRLVLIERNDIAGAVDELMR